MTRATVAEAKHLEGKVVRYKGQSPLGELVTLVVEVVSYEDFAERTGNTLIQEGRGKAVLRCVNRRGHESWKRSDLDKWEIYEE